MKEALVGFDSAWGGKNPGGIAYAIFQGDVLEKEGLPQLVSFPKAAAIINDLRKECDDVLVAIDQPTIVPNKTFCRPVDRVAKSFMGKLQGAAFVAKRETANLFGDYAPIWEFASNISHTKYLGRRDDGIGNPLVDFEAAKTATGQTHLIEVYPALALPALEPKFMARGVAPKYNPQGKNFSLSDWQDVCKAVRQCADRSGLRQLSQWADGMVKLAKPKKVDQDQIDAAICLLIALWWRKARAEHGLTVIGALESGYMVVPTSPETRKVFQEVAAKRKVWISPVASAGTD